jgi:hypothetical protein
VAALFEIALWRTGESWPLARVVDTQLNFGETPSLYGRMLFSQQFNLYKYAMIKRKRPKIVIHGTSRVMQIRDFMFHPLESWFYNAGGMIQGPEDALAYAEMIRRGELPKPEVVIFGPDPWWLKQRDSDEGWLDVDSLQDTARHFPAHVEAARLLLRQRAFPWNALVDGAPRPSPGYGFQAIGAKPLFDGEGFRIDGSLQLSPELVLGSIADPSYRDRNEIFGMVAEHRSPFSLPAAIDPSRVDQLIQAFMELRRLGIEVQIFLPPFASEVHDLFETAPVWNAFWSAYRLEFPSRLRDAGIICLPLSVPTQDGFDDTYMYDGYHPSEIYATAIVKQIVEQSPKRSLLKKVHLGHLNKLLSKNHPSPLAFDEPKHSM